MLLKPARARGVWTSPLVFCRYLKNIFAHLFMHLCRTCCEKFKPMSLNVRSPGHDKWLHLIKSLNARHSYTEWTIALKLSAIDALYSSIFNKMFGVHIGRYIVMTSNIIQFYINSYAFQFPVKQCFNCTYWCADDGKPKRVRINPRPSRGVDDPPPEVFMRCSPNFEADRA